MATARGIMTAETKCVGENETIADAARMMRDLGIGSLPICGEDQRLRGMMTDRDIVIRCVADGDDPDVTGASGLAQGKPVTIGADDDIEKLRATMKDHQIRPVPVIDGDELVGSSHEATSPRRSRTIGSGNSSHHCRTGSSVRR